MKQLQNAIKSSLLDKHVFAEDAVVTDYAAFEFVPVKEFVREGFDIHKQFPKERSTIPAEEVAHLNAQIQRLAGVGKKNAWLCEFKERNYHKISEIKKVFL